MSTALPTLWSITHTDLGVHTVARFKPDGEEAGREEVYVSVVKMAPHLVRDDDTVTDASATLGVIEVRAETSKVLADLSGSVHVNRYEAEALAVGKAVLRAAMEARR